jgi:cytochrome P450
LAKTTLDAIGLAALGTQFNNIDAPTEFSLAFEDVFSQARSTMSVLMSVLNAYMPIRKLLPIKVNRDYLGANAKIRSLLVQHIRKRQQEIDAMGKSSAKGKDLLTILIQDGVGGKQPWTEDEIVNHVSLLSVVLLETVTLTYIYSAHELHGRW